MVQDADELVAIVDREDNVRYVTQRKIADRYKLRMRTARTIIFDPDDRIWVHKRALKKPVNRGLYDVGTGETPAVAFVNGHYEHEPYEHASRRGVSEEMFDRRLSIEDIFVEHVAMLPPIDVPSSPRNYEVFSFHYDPARHGPINPEPDEVDCCCFLAEKELNELLMRKKSMGIAPVIAQLALYIIKNPGVTLNPSAIPINLDEVCFA